MVVFDHHADAVGIGISGHDQVGSYLPGPGNGHFHGRRLFRIGGNHRRKIPADHVLLGYMDNIGEAKGMQGPGNHRHTGAVDRGVDDLHIVVFLHDVGRKRDAFYLFNEPGVGLFTQDDDVLPGAVEADLFRSDGFHLVDDVDVVGFHDLAAIVPISFVAVVFFGIMGSGDDDAALASVFPDGERHLGGRPEILKEEGLDAVGGKNASAAFGKEPAVVTAVVTDGHPDLREVGKIPFQIVAETLCGGPHGVNVHPVGTRSHDAAQSAGTKLQILVKRVNEFGFVGIGKHTCDGAAGLFVIDGR